MQSTQGQITSSKPSFGTTLPIHSQSQSVDTSADYDLFSEIVLDTIPTMPEDLLPYFVDVTNALAKSEAESVFLVWLKKEIDHQPYMKEGVSVVCESDLKSIEVFFPEFAYDDDFRARDADGNVIDPKEDVSQNFERNRIDAVAYINIAKARRECSACPMRVQCLTKSLMMPPGEYSDIIEGIWGGHYEGGRRKIAGQFNAMRRAYQSGRKAMEAGTSKSNWPATAMTKAEIKKADARAVSLVLA